MANFCLICNTPTTRTTVLKNGKIYHHCDNCDFTHIDPQFHLSAEQEKLRYDQHQNTSDNTEYLEIFERFIKTAVTDCFTALAMTTQTNFGSSTLAITPQTKHSTEQAVTILDYGSGPSPVLATILKKQGYNTDIYDPYYAPQEPSKQYDLITSTEVFEHLRNPLETLTHIKELLKSNGYLAIMTKFLPASKDFRAWRYKDDTTHISFYSPKTFSQIAKLLGLSVIKHNNEDTIILAKCSANSETI